MKACCATCASRRRASSRSPWWRRWSRRKKTSWKRRKRETSRQDLPRVRIRRACARLQGRPDLEPLPHRARQDSAQPVVGNVCAAPAAARDGDQARAAARLDSVHQGSHSINTKPSWWRLLLALVAFVFWAPASLVGLPCAALLILAPASDPPSGGGWSQPIAGILGAVSVALLVIGGGGGGGRLAAVTSAYIVLTTAAFVSLVLVRPDAILRQALRSVVAAGVACALLIRVMWGSEAWRGLAWEATRQASSAMRTIVEVAPDAFPIYEPMVRFMSLTWPGMLALQTLAGLALAWQLHVRIATAGSGVRVPLTRFKDFNIGDGWVWGIIAWLGVLILPVSSALHIAGTNVGLVAGTLFVLRGAAIVATFAEAFGVSAVALVLMAAAAAALAVPLLFVLPGLCTLGITDTWYQYRRRLAEARARQRSNTT